MLAHVEIFDAAAHTTRKPVEGDVVYVRTKDGHGTEYNARRAVHNGSLCTVKRLVPEPEGRKVPAKALVVGRFVEREDPKPEAKSTRTKAAKGGKTSTTPQERELLARSITLEERVAALEGGIEKILAALSK